MSHLIAISFVDKFAAEQALLQLRSLEKEYLLALEDAVIVTRDEKGRVRLQQSVDLAASGALSGGWWGMLVGLIIAGPLGLVLTGIFGAAFGALAGSLQDYGIDDRFMSEIGHKLKEGRSALFVLLQDATYDKVLDKIKDLRGEVIQTSLTKENEEELKAVLEPESASATSSN